MFFVNTLAFADVNVVIMTPKEGRYEKLGAELIKGTEIAVDDINNNGGLQGERINLISIDDPCDDTLSVSTAQMMAVNSSKDDKVSLVIGPYCSNSFEEIADIYAKAKIFQIIPTTMGVNNYKHSHKGLVKLVGSKERQGKDFYNFSQENYSDKMVAIIYDSNDRDIVDIAATIQAEFVKEKMSDRLKSFDYNRYKNADALTDAVIESGARLAYILGGSEKVTEAFRDLKEKNKNFVIFTNKYQLVDEYNEALGKIAEDSYMIALPSLTDNPSFTEELVKLRLLGIEPEGLSVYSYTAVKLWGDLVAKAKSFDYDKLAKELETSKFETTWGEVMFNNGAPQDDINYGIYKVRSDHVEKVY
jgi:branched-chain amino acid transport system substrate-binding protein